MKLSDALVVALKHIDAHYVFGVSGANIEHLHDAINRLGSTCYPGPDPGSSISSILAKCELSAAFMADAHAREHNKIAVCCATSGAGMCNLLPGIAESYAENVPVLAIIGQAPTNLEGQGAFQDSSGKGRSFNAVNLWKHVTKEVIRITNQADFWTIFQHAVSTCLTEPMGPVALLIPRDLYEGEVGVFEGSIKKIPLGPQMIPRGQAAGNHSESFDALRNAKNPVMIVGPHFRRSQAHESFLAFAQQSNIPVALSMHAFGEYPHDAPNFLGIVGMAGHPSAHTFINNTCDLIVGIGTELDVMTRTPIAEALKKIPTILMGPTLTNVPTLQNVQKLECNLLQASNFLFEQLKKHPFRFDCLQSYEKTVYNPVIKSADSEKFSANKSTLLQSQAIAVLNEFLPSKGHIIFDAGNCTSAAMHYLKLPSQVSAHIALGMGSMGYAIGASIGAQLSSPKDNRTVVIIGDGGFLMTGLEVHTAVEHSLPILFIVFNNGKHGMCISRQDLYFDGRVEAAVIGNINIAHLARGLGDERKLWVGTATTHDEMVMCMKDYLKHNKPGVLELKLNVEEIPPFFAFLPKDAETVSFKNWIRSA